MAKFIELTDYRTKKAVLVKINKKTLMIQETETRHYVYENLFPYGLFGTEEIVFTKIHTKEGVVSVLETPEEIIKRSKKNERKLFSMGTNKKM